MKEFIELLGYVRKYNWYVALNILCNVLMALFMVVSIPAVIPFFQILFDRQAAVLEPQALSLSNLEAYLQYNFSVLINSRTKEDALTVVCLGLVVLFFFKNFFRYMSMFFMAYVRNGVVRDLRQVLYEKYLDLPFSYFSNERKGDLLGRITTDIQEVEVSILRVLEITFREPIVMLGSVAFMVLISPQLTLFVFVLILFTAFVIGGVSRSLRRQSRQAQDMLANIMSIVEEGLAGMRIIKAFNGEGLQKKRLAEENDNYSNLMTRIFWRRDLSSPLSEFLGVTVVVVLLWFGSRLVFEQQLAPETFFAFLFAFYNVINPAKAFSSAYYFIQKGLASIDRINEVLKVENPISDSPDAVELASFESEIAFRKVSFKYPGHDSFVLRDIELTIRKGQIIALVGASGSGKSTLVDLIPRFHDPSAGSIEIDGTDLRNYTVESLRDKMGIVTQEAVLFNDTIRSNIQFSTDNASDEVIRQAANYANATQFIDESEAGYETRIGDRGMKLSGGQRQRLTIARALAKNPPILILDEATAALDSESEKLVQKALEYVMQGRTSIIIAHRLSTIMHADLIYVLKNGKVVESGTHEELQMRDGEYKKFVALQAFN